MVESADPGDGPTLSWRELWVETTDAVGDRSHARWLCEVASASIDGDEFLARLDEPATVRMAGHLDAMTARLSSGEPLQYVHACNRPSGAHPAAGDRTRRWRRHREGIRRGTDARGC